MILTKNELEIMEVLWENGEPITSSDIVKKSVDKSWKSSSIHILINSLLDKKAIEEVGFVRTGKGFGRTFAPTIEGEKYYANCLAKMAKKTSMSTLFAALFKSDEIDGDTLEELELLIKNKKKEIK